MTSPCRDTLPPGRLLGLRHGITLALVVVVLSCGEDERNDDWVDCEEGTCGVCTYDRHGNITRSRVDYDCDGGGPDECASWTRDDGGNLLRYALDRGCDGRADECETHTRAGDGTIMVRYDTECDGTVDAWAVIESSDGL